MHLALPILVSLPGRVMTSDLIPEASLPGLKRWLWARATACCGLPRTGMRINGLLLRLVLATAGCVEA